MEKKLERGESATWWNYDFEKVGERILDKTSVCLSTTTLKRIWGRIKYRNAPTTSTLNALAQYLEYEDWREFLQKADSKPGMANLPERKISIADIPKNETKHSAIYYFPGFFRTKLIVGDQVVKQHDLQVSSDGWLGLVEQDEGPFYFQKEEITKQDRMEVDEATLRSNGFGLMPTAPKVRFFNQGDMGHLMNDDFEFETKVKNDFKIGTNLCQYVEVLIQCKDDIIIIPLMAPECVGEAKLYIPGKEFQSKFSDLSGFGANWSEWTTLKVVTRKKEMNIYINDALAFTYTFPNKATGIVGVQYRFNGVGAVKDTRFKGPDGIIKL